MTVASCKFGVVGLAVMGENLALNIERNGFPVAVYNRTTSVTDAFVAGRGAGKKMHGAKSIEDFVKSLERPRRILIMVKAGGPVDAVIEQLAPLLEEGDILIDGGNSHYPDTERRAKATNGKPYRFFGMGVSGGEEGALWGPSLMPGGDKPSYEDLRPVLEAIAAKTDSGPCVTWCGHGSAGHFVKMVHNGIEYGDMQLIAESYDLLRTVAGIERGDEMEEIFREWNAGELQSFLIEITADIVNHRDALAGDNGLLLDRIQDKAGQKGTGKWTTVAAMELGVPIPTITAAVDARLLSSLKEQRVAAEKWLPGPVPGPTGVARAMFVRDVREALYAAKICSYAQGLALLRAASEAFGYETEVGAIARIWKGGCIIRAVFLDAITQAFERNHDLVNLLVDEEFAESVRTREGALRRVVQAAAAAGLAVPAMSASLAYYDTYRRARGPAYVIQAQRDYFGAHTFERTDRPGSFHEQWIAKS